MTPALVPYIPWSCSLVFRPEPQAAACDVQLHVGFTPAWFADRMELDYGKRWHEDPRVHQLLDVVCETMLRFTDEVQARQNRSGARRDYFATANCVVNMISKKWPPDLAEPEVAFPHYIDFTTNLMKDLGISRRTATGA